MKKLCKFCKKLFNAERQRRQFCSRKCTLKIRENRIKLICPICSKKFITHACRQNRGTILYCSKECSFKGRQKQEELICKQCKNKFTAHICQKAKFCSKKCYGIYNREGHHYLWKGNRRYDGDKIIYSSIHKWVRRELGSAYKCSSCKINSIPPGKKRYFDWANISRQYKRDTSDWIQLCKKCHGEFDSEYRHKIKF